MTIPALTIRRAISNDVEAIVRISNAGGPQGKPRKALPDVLPETYWQAFATIDVDPHQQLMVAEFEGEVVGTFHVTYITYLAGAGQPDAMIEAVHIVGAHRRRGFGTVMLQWAITEARRRGCRRIQLTTDKQRTEAHAIYQRLGFVFSHEGAKLYL